MKKNTFQKTKNKFNRSQLMRLSDLTPSSFQTLVDNRAVNKGTSSPLYELSDVVYFRLIKILRYEFSMQDIRKKILYTCEFYKDDLLNHDYASISLNTKEPERMVFCKINDASLRNHLQEKIMYIERKTDYGAFGKISHEHKVWLNLSEIINNLLVRSRQYRIDNIDLKFGELNEKTSYPIACLH